MRSISRPFRLVLAVVVGLAMSAMFAASASAVGQSAAPASEATWQLSEGEQRLCIPAERTYRSYFVGSISGSWDTPLTAVVNDLPEGTVVSMTETVPPGDHGDRSIGIIWILVDLPPLAYGEYPAELVVTDGTVTQTAPLVIKAQEKWGCNRT